MKKVAFFFHGGSKNHGCEAIVRATTDILQDQAECLLYTFAISEDQKFNLQKVLPIVQLGKERLHLKAGTKKIVKKFLPSFLLHIWHEIKMKLQYNSKYKIICSTHPAAAFSIGGDNYCYGENKELTFTNYKLSSSGIKTILWGCSIEPQDIAQNEALRTDLKQYALITTRESSTYEALMKYGINKNTHLFPDPAFVMGKNIPKGLPAEFVPGKTVGINLSPLVQRLEKNKDIAFRNCEYLVRYILKNTSLYVAFIPHVIWENNNDLEPLSRLYHKFKDTGRVCLIDKSYNALELKGIISQCRFMVAARTHASIAAYSTQVPTLVIGYSVKARGIARDIFGTEEGYVLPVQGLQQEDEITNAFINLMQKEDKIRAHYKEFMPEYIAKAWKAGEEVNKLLLGKQI